MTIFNVALVVFLLLVFGAMALVFIAVDNVISSFDEEDS